MLPQRKTRKSKSKIQGRLKKAASFEFFQKTKKEKACPAFSSARKNGEQKKCGYGEKQGDPTVFLSGKLMEKALEIYIISRYTILCCICEYSRLMRPFGWSGG